ncbi:type IV conjugative transfer system lipoprotein TraV [Rubrivivax gelatinosus]|uniref:type IV conjugative transfer system lipoprotein TraV n=1 Tax=Rubrivivax gelatinosus TaxID=28068 RepID=UPI000311BD04|nr:type IV conjugative transfer system lipoprotein TraV [Rubrivivax gelatinosus]MBG6083007.1 conjugal transfer pilus assembly protein TraV [Rubrivivax gelatinosus]
MKADLALFLVLAALASGCSTVLSPTDTDEYGCKLGEAKATCRTPLAIYRSTHGEPPVTETDAAVPWGRLVRGTSGKLVDGQAEQADAKSPSSAERLLSAASAAPGAVPGLNAKTLGLMAPTVAGRPVREPAQVMRIWIAPWIDKNDDLHYPSYLFTEVQPRRWTFGKQEFAGRGVVVPHKDFASTDPQRSTASAVERSPSQVPAKPATPAAGAAEGSSSADFTLPN